MVAHRVQGLEGRHLRDQVIDGDADPFGRLAPDLANVGQVLHLQHAGDLRVLSEDFFVHALRARRSFEIGEGISEDGLVRRRRALG